MKDDRRSALDTIIDVLEKDAYLPGRLSKHSVRKNRFGQSARGRSGYTGRVCRGVVERAIELDYRLATISSMKLKRMHPVVRNVLRLGAYEILYMDSIPTAATVNEMVTLTKRKGQKRAAGMVNAVLRKVENTSCNKVPYKYSIPAWLYDRLKGQFGKEADDICEAFLQEVPLTLRINQSAVSEEKWEQLLKDAGISFEQITRGVYSLLDYDSIEAIPGYNEGFWYIQNPSSTMSASMAGIKPGMKVLDMCAAPGGKSLHAADLCGPEGSVLSRDISEAKVKLIRENIERSPFSNTEAEVWDATVFDEASVDGFDVVIADVPCSGVGVIGRKPEIKYRLKQEDISQLASIQKSILENACRYVKDGGRLVYSTCTVLDEENHRQIRAFLETHEDYVYIEEKQILPHDVWDGFYICVMEKKRQTS